MAVEFCIIHQVGEIDARYPAPEDRVRIAPPRGPFLDTQVSHGCRRHGLNEAQPQGAFLA